MGTNFYCTKIPTAEEHQKMQELLMEKQYEKLKELIEESNPTYHIGKRSAGWQFLFAPHKSLYQPWETPNPWENTLESIKEYLAREDVVIKDEYGEVFTSEQFWNDEIGYCLYNNLDKYINGEQYDEREMSKFPCASHEFTTKEGLRFSTDIDFS